MGHRETRKRRREPTCSNRDDGAGDPILMLEEDQQRCDTPGVCRDLPCTLSPLPHAAGVTGLDGVSESYFFIHINGRPTRVTTAAPFINTRELFGHAGVLLQDVTVRGFPILLLPSPHTGNVTVHPRRWYRLMKFIGEHLCVAGDFAPVSNDDNDNNDKGDDDDGNTGDVVMRARSFTEDDGMRGKRPHVHGRRNDAWAMNEMMAMMDFMRQHPRSTPKDFQDLSPRTAALYHARGSIALRRWCGVDGSERNGSSSDCDTDENVEKGNGTEEGAEAGYQ